jgi:serine protease AprX
MRRVATTENSEGNDMRRKTQAVSGARASALWGTGGRGPRRIGAILAATTVVLCLPLAAGAHSFAARHSSATVPASLVAAAKTHPQQMFDVIVQSTDGATSADAAGAVRQSARSRVIKRQYHALHSVSASLTGAGLVRLAKRPGIYAITPNSAVTSTVKNPQKWPGATDIDWFWGSPFVKSKAATIAIVDSGVDNSNNQFGDRLLTQVDFTAPGASTSSEVRGHGTFVAGVAASSGRFGGAAPGANLVSLKVFDDQGRGMTSDVLRATDWILQHKDQYGIRVANFSLQTGISTSFRFDPLDRALEQLWQSGVVVVAAAGNYASNGAPSGVLFSPANDPFVITVGAVDVGGDSGTGNDTNAPWSAYGYTVDGFAKPDIGAPGRYMNEWVPAGTSLAAERPNAVIKDGMELSGTSFAAPVVSGIAANVLGVHPEWTPDQVKGALMRSATVIKKAAPLSLGVGEVDIQKALEHKTAPPNPNAGLDQFLVPDPNGSPYPVFDSASWLKVAKSDASWNSASWVNASWNSASWNAASWNSASWNSDSFLSASWNTASWLKVLVTDNAATETGGEG